MPVRTFSGASVIRCALGIDLIPSAGCSMAVLAKIKEGSAGNFMQSIFTSGGSDANRPRLGGSPLGYGGGSASEAFKPSNFKDKWALFVGTRVGTSNPRVHIYDFVTEEWLHETQGANVSSFQASPGGQKRLGQAASQFEGEMAAAACWTQALSDALVEQLVQVASLDQWLETSPASLWFLDQASVETPVTDLTGNGADEVSREATSVKEEEPPIPYEGGEPQAPIAVTGSATNISDVTAIVHGTVKANEASTDYYFEYGLTESYGTKIPVGEDGEGGSSNFAIDVERFLTGLKRGETYHYRLVAVNEKGEHKGEDKTFATVSVAPQWITGIGNPTKVAVDKNFVYWVDTTSGKIGRANLNGSEPNFSWFDPPGNVNGIAVNATHLFWTDPDLNSIGRANIDGSEPSNEWIKTNNDPKGVALDANFIYWAINGTTDFIARAKIDGTEVNNEWITGPVNPDAVEVDAEHVYWGIFGTIGRAKIDGTEVTTLWITAPTGFVTGVTVNASFIYWTDTTADAIGRANIDGSEPNTGWVADPVNPQDCVVDGKYVYWADDNPNTIGKANLGAETPEAPVAVTGIASAIGEEGATLNGTVDANFSPTDYYFEYGLTESYGTKIPVGEDGDAGEEGEPASVDEIIAGLEPATTYHFRLVAVNAEGEDVGEDETFKTKGEGEGTTVKVKTAGGLVDAVRWIKLPNGELVNL